MQDYRCVRCAKLLAKIGGEARVEIKCPRCKKLNNFNKTNTNQNAQSVPLEHRECHTRNANEQLKRHSKT